MLLFDGAFGLLVFALWIFCVIDVITTDEHRMRHLPKTAWVLIVLLFVDFGAVVWLVAGRPWPSAAAPRRAAGGRFPEYDRPGRFAATSDADDDEFLRRCRERAEEQRLRYREEQRRRETEGDA
ncbi:MAG: PLDc N-terminal domain-containing protein [Nocardioides sp.]